LQLNFTILLFLNRDSRVFPRKFDENFQLDRENGQFFIETWISSIFVSVRDGEPRATENCAAETNGFFRSLASLGGF
jgi:hypothetical protein